MRSKRENAVVRLGSMMLTLTQLIYQTIYGVTSENYTYLLKKVNRRIKTISDIAKGMKLR